MGMPSIGGQPPQSSRPGIEEALAQATAEQGAPAPAPDEDTEVEARIMRLEEALVSRGVLTEGDLTGPPGSDDQGNMPPEVGPDGQPVPPQGGAGAPPAPPAGGPPPQV